MTAVLWIKVSFWPALKRQTPKNSRSLPNQSPSTYLEMPPPPLEYSEPKGLKAEKRTTSGSDFWIPGFTKTEGGDALPPVQSPSGPEKPRSCQLSMLTPNN